MKKLMSLMLGLSLVLGTAVLSFASPQEEKKTTEKKKKAPKKKKGEKKKEEKPA